MTPSSNSWTAGSSRVAKCQSKMTEDDFYRVYAVVTWSACSVIKPGSEISSVLTEMEVFQVTSCTLCAVTKHTSRA